MRRLSTAYLPRDTFVLSIHSTCEHFTARRPPPWGCFLCHAPSSVCRVVASASSSVRVLLKKPLKPVHKEPKSIEIRHSTEDHKQDHERDGASEKRNGYPLSKPRKPAHRSLLPFLPALSLKQAKG